MPRYRVGEGGLRVFHRNGSYDSLPPGTEIEEIPLSYTGILHVVEWKRIDGYQDKMLRPDEDKSGGPPEIGLD